MFGLTDLKVSSDHEWFAIQWPPEISQLMNQLAGKTWVAELEQKGETYTIEETIEWWPGNGFLHSRVEIYDSKGEIRASTMGVMAWNSARGKIQLWQFRNDGSFGSAVQTLDPRKGALSFEVQSLTGSEVEWADASTVIAEQPLLTLTTTLVPVHIGPGMEPISTSIVYRVKTTSNPIEALTA